MNTYLEYLMISSHFDVGQFVQYICYDENQVSHISEVSSPTGWVSWRASVIQFLGSLISEGGYERLVEIFYPFTYHLDNDRLVAQWNLML